MFLRAVVATTTLLILSIDLHGRALAEARTSDGLRPNLIYIMCDDLGYGDLGCFGQPRIQTPNLDRMAAEGLRLTDYYACGTVCRPSRLGLWTGQHLGHTAINANDSYVMRPEDVTLAELLKAAGYTTGGFGKWAMGGVETSGHPNQNGFDLWMGYLDQSEAHNYYPTHLWRNSKRVPLPGNKIGDYPTGRGRVASKRTTYSHDVITTELFDFIRNNRASPFLAHVHWTIPHANNEGGRVTGNGMEVPSYGIYANREWPEPEKGHAAMITRMDADVGRLLNLLVELKIDRHTLVVFTSDNGPHSEGKHDHKFFDSNGPLRGFKRDLYEGGIRVPTIAWMPGRIEAGRVSREPLAGYDWLATACELAGGESAGISVPPESDGISFVPTLLGTPQTSHRYLYWAYQDKQAVRFGRWKAVIAGQDASSQGVTNSNRIVELYDLSQDIGETMDLSNQHPQVVAQARKYMAEATAARRINAVQAIER